MELLPTIKTQRIALKVLAPADSALMSKSASGTAIAVILICLLSGQALAAPASWYKWKSKMNGQLACAQSSPGEGWQKQEQAYKDARCRVAIPPILDPAAEAAANRASR